MKVNARKKHTMENKLFSLISLLLLALNANSQDGKIVKLTPYVVADSSINKWKKNIPNLESIIKSVDFFGITYLSDGLKVNGYLAVPKKAGKFPVVIFNRGGASKFGALTEGQIIRFLAVVADWGYVCIASQYRGHGGSEGKDPERPLNGISDFPLATRCCLCYKPRYGASGD